MKKVIILQNKGKTYGGVWQVNRLVGEELIKNGYDVSVISIRNNQNDLVVEHDEKLKIHTINEKDEWGTYSGTEILEELKKFNIIKSLKMIGHRINYSFSIKKDIKKLHEILELEQPNYIITSHYELLDMIPIKYLPIVINEFHSSFKSALDNRSTINTFKKYNNKINFVWLTKKTMEEATNYGLNNCHYIYNAVRFKSNRVADVLKEKKLITISRIDYQKNIFEMVDIAKKVFEDKKYSSWKLEIFGDGTYYEDICKLTKDNKQIKMMGRTNNPKEELLHSSINLNTSFYEGFSLSILEANECGIPTITYDFGESVKEEIINNKTGIIANTKEDYINNLKELMDNNDKLLEMSKECKKFSDKFQIENIIKDWIKLFNKIDNK